MTAANEPSVAELVEWCTAPESVSMAMMRDTRFLKLGQIAAALTRLERRCAEMEKELAAKQPLPASWCTCLGWCYFNEGHHANCTCKAERHGIGPMYQPPERANEGKTDAT